MRPTFQRDSSTSFVQYCKMTSTSYASLAQHCKTRCERYPRKLLLPQRRVRQSAISRGRATGLGHRLATNWDEGRIWGGGYSSTVSPFRKLHGRHRHTCWEPAPEVECANHPTVAGT